MISDVLSDSADEIRDYLRTMPDMYKDTMAEILDLLGRMDALRIRLDTPPGEIVTLKLADGGQVEIDPGEIVSYHCATSPDGADENGYVKFKPGARSVKLKDGRELELAQLLTP